MNAAIAQRLWDAAEDYRLDPSQLKVTVTLANGETVSGSPVAIEDGLLWLQLPGEEVLREIHLATVVDAITG